MGIHEDTYFGVSANSNRARAENSSILPRQTWQRDHAQKVFMVCFKLLNPAEKMCSLRKITLLDGAVTMRGLQSRAIGPSPEGPFFEYQEYNSIKFNMLLLSSQRKISSNMLRNESISRILRTADSDRVFYRTMPFKQRSVASHVTAEEIGSDSAVIHDQHRVTVLVSHISCCVMVG
jgi:hypothetical protein